MALKISFIKKFPPKNSIILIKSNFQGKLSELLSTVNFIKFSSFLLEKHLEDYKRSEWKGRSSCSSNSKLTRGSLKEENIDRMSSCDRKLIERSRMIVPPGSSFCNSPMIWKIISRETLESFHEIVSLS